jgi:hypothetical protein
VYNGDVAVPVRKIKRNIDALYRSPLVVIDGNVCAETMKFVIGFCNEENIPGKAVS